MRAALAFAAILTVSVAVFRQSLPEPEFSFESLVPRDALALLVIRGAPAGLEALFLETRLSEKVDIDLDSLHKRFPEEVRREAGQMIEQDLESAWLIVHGLQKRPGAWHPSFTVILSPRPLHAELLELRLELLTMRLLGREELLVSDDGDLRVYRAESPKTSLYRVRMPGFLLLSNTAEGLRQTLQCSSRQDPNILSSPAFQRVKAKVGINQGLFLYVNAPNVISLLPQFGYSMQWTGDRLLDRFYAVSKEGAFH